MNAPGSEPALRDFEPAAFAEQHVARRHADVLEVDFHVAVRRVVVAEHAQRPHHVDARRVGRHQDHRLLRMARRFGIGLAHHDVDPAARIARARDPPLAAVDHVIVAVAQDRRLDVGRIARCDRRLGHHERGADLAGQQRLLATVLLRVGAVALDRFHVAGVGRGAVEHLGRPRNAAHRFGQRRVFEIGQPGAMRRVAEETDSTIPRPGPSASTPRSAWSVSSVHRALCSFRSRRWKRCSFG